METAIDIESLILSLTQELVTLASEKAEQNNVKENSDRVVNAEGKVEPPKPHHRQRLFLHYFPIEANARWHRQERRFVYNGSNDTIQHLRYDSRYRQSLVFPPWVSPPTDRDLCDFGTTLTNRFRLSTFVLFLRVRRLSFSNQSVAFFHGVCLIFISMPAAPKLFYPFTCFYYVHLCPIPFAFKLLSDYSHRHRLGSNPRIHAPSSFSSPRFTSFTIYIHRPWDP